MTVFPLINALIRDPLALYASVLSMMSLALEVGALVIINEILRQLETSVHFSLERMLFDGLLSLYMFNALLILSRYFSFHLQVVAHLHLVFNQILCLGEVTNKLLTFFTSQVADPCFVNDARNLQLFLLVLKFFLLVEKFLTEYFFFLVQIDENFKILVKFVGLLLLDYFLYFSLLSNFLSKLVFFFLILCYDCFNLGILFDSVRLNLPLLQ